MKWRLLIFSVTFLLVGCVTTTRPGVVGVNRQQFLLVPAGDVERMAAVSYAQQYSKAKSQGRLITEGAELTRLKKIGSRLIRQSGEFRDDTKQWKWNLTLIDAPVLNASCAPGGKITFFTGIIRKLDLTDDEIAAVMGHEIAHALREHGRERLSNAVAQKALTNLALVSTQNKEKQIQLANQFAHYLFVLPNSRENENEADKIGLELSARAGYDPRAAVNVWRKMMAVMRGQNPPEFLSTHPAHSTRIAEISALLPKVIPLYEAAPKP